jgi:hypothetical protein
VHSQDLIPKLTGALAPLRRLSSAIIGPLTGLRHYSMKQGEITEIDGAGFSDAHKLRTYLDNLPEFLVAAHKQNDEVDGRGLAYALAGVIRDGAFADHLVQEVLDRMEEEKNTEFFEALKQYAPAGRIGNFVVPQFQKNDWEFAHAA